MLLPSLAKMPPAGCEDFFGDAAQAKFAARLPAGRL
jgi:hypothetical protein